MLTDKKFCILIVSHGRPDSIRTLQVMTNCGYTGPWYIVMDDEDETIDQYRARYGSDRIVVFDKKEFVRTTDTADQVNQVRSAAVVFARNACWKIAQDLGYEFFMVMDDDYTSLSYRFEHKGLLWTVPVRKMDKLCELSVRFLERSPIACFAWAQGGDLIGGKSSNSWDRRYKHKAMNTFFLRASDEWRFFGRLNEDVNTYVTLAHRGLIFLTTYYAQITQRQTQGTKGGLTEAYLETGTYVKSFYTVMMNPSSVRISCTGVSEMRIHHQILWDHVTPRILDERHRKPREKSGKVKRGAKN